MFVLMADRRRVMVFIDWFTPAFKAGGPIQSVASIIYTFHKEVDFYVITSDRDLGDAAAMSGIILNSWQTRQDCQVIYLTPDQQNNKNYSRWVEEYDIDMLYFNSLFSIPFTLKPLLAFKRRSDLVKIVAPRGMLGEGALKIKARKKQLFLQAVKLIGLFKNVGWHASSTQELREIQRVFSKTGPVHVAMNLPSVAVERLSGSVKKQDKDRLTELLFVSRLSPKKNLLLLLQTLQTLKRSDWRLQIVGPVDDADYWAQCQLLINELGESVVVRGPLPPDQVAEVMSGVHYFVLPTAHENYGHVIIEAMYCGAPAIISPNTPWADIEDKGAGYLVDLKTTASLCAALQKAIDLSQDKYNIQSTAAGSYARNVRSDAKGLAANRAIFLG